jgi:hypothetical protein
VTGLVEPAERRYQVDFGAYAQVYFDGQPGRLARLVAPAQLPVTRLTAQP